MSRWFRHYAGMMRDEKLVGVALRCKQPVERVIWVWGAILESAAEINDAGRYELDTAEISYFLRSDESDIVSITACLEGAGRVRENRVVNWANRQFQSDRSATRQKDYRERQKAQRDGGGDGRAVGSDGRKAESDGNVTSPSRHGDAPELETDTELELETDKKKKKDFRAVAKATRPDVAFEEFWKNYPKRDGANPKAPARKKYLTAVKSGVEPAEILAAVKRFAEAERKSEHIGTPYVAQAMTWLNQQRWGDYTQQVETSQTHMPPSSDLPSDDELRRKYGAPDEQRDEVPAPAAETPRGGAYLPAKLFPARSRADHGDEFRGDNRAGGAGMRSLGEIFRRSSALATVGITSAPERGDLSDDGSDPLA